MLQNVAALEFASARLRGTKSLALEALALNTAALQHLTAELRCLSQGRWRDGTHGGNAWENAWDRYIYIHMFLYIYIHVSLYTCMKSMNGYDIYIYIYIYVYVYVYVYIHTYIHMVYIRKEPRKWKKMDYNGWDVCICIHTVFYIHEWHITCIHRYSGHVYI